MADWPQTKRESEESDFHGGGPESHTVLADVPVIIGAIVSALFLS